MSSLERVLKVAQGPARAMEALRTSLEELDWITVRDAGGQIICKQKGRFDHFNPVEAVLKVSEKDGGSVILIDAKNLGIGTLQHDFLMGQIEKLLAALMVHLEDAPVVKADPAVDCSEAQSIAREIEALSELHRKGELSEIEFKKAKERILGS